MRRVAADNSLRTQKVIQRILIMLDRYCSLAKLTANACSVRQKSSPVHSARYRFCGNKRTFFTRPTANSLRTQEVIQRIPIALDRYCGKVLFTAPITTNVIARRGETPTWRSQLKSAGTTLRRKCRTEKRLPHRLFRAPRNDILLFCCTYHSFYA